MRNFILFIRRFFNLILFLALEVVCFLLVSRTQTLQGDEVLSSANALSGIVYQKREDVIYYFGLKRMNDSLLQENTRLRSQLAKFIGVDTFVDQTVLRPIATDDSARVVEYARYRYHPARVINNSVTQENNYITINRGSTTGIRKNMSVISGNGIVGRVIHVSEHFASVLSVLSLKQKVSARLEDGTFGSVMWEEGVPDILLMEDIPGEIKVFQGDSVFTTQYSFFPPDILIGTVEGYRVNPQTNMKVLYLKTATDFQNLQYVYVVENKMASEKRKLEQLNEGQQ